MPDKYELFLDKNKKVKLSADEQGNFFAEANDKKIKLGSNGLENVDGNGVASPVGADLTALDQSIIPDTNEVYDLGSAEKKFRHLYLSSNSLFVGDTKITSDPTTGALTTAVADEQGVFGAVSAVGPENVAGGTDLVTITKGLTHDGTTGNLAPTQLSIGFLPHSDSKAFITGTAFNGATLETGQSGAGQYSGTELGFTERGFRMQDTSSSGNFQYQSTVNGRFFEVQWVIMPGNENVFANYDQEHANTADLRWYFTDDLGSGNLVWELRNKNTNESVNFSDVYVVAQGLDLFDYTSYYIPGGVPLDAVFSAIQNGDINPSPDYTPPGFGSPPPMNFPNNATWGENQPNVTITGSLKMTFDGANYKLTRNSSSGAIETVAI